MFFLEKEIKIKKNHFWYESLVNLKLYLKFNNIGFLYLAQMMHNTRNVYSI